MWLYVPKHNSKVLISNELIEVKWFLRIMTALEQVSNMISYSAWILDGVEVRHATSKQKVGGSNLIGCKFLFFSYLILIFFFKSLPLIQVYCKTMDFFVKMIQSLLRWTYIWILIKIDPKKIFLWYQARTSNLMVSKIMVI